MTVAGLRVVRLDDAAQLGPRDDLLHRREKHIALGRLALLLVLRVLVASHGKGLLLHARFNAGDVPAAYLISVALTHLSFLGAGNRILDNWRTLGPCGKYSRWMRKKCRAVVLVRRTRDGALDLRARQLRVHPLRLRRGRRRPSRIATGYARFGSRPRTALKQALGRLFLAQLGLKFEGRRCDGVLTIGRGRYQASRGHLRSFHRPENRFANDRFQNTAAIGRPPLEGVHTPKRSHRFLRH